MTCLITVSIFLLINLSHSYTEFSPGYISKRGKRSSIEPTCPSKIEERKIIQTTKSIKNGALFIPLKVKIKSQSDCLRECCQRPNCSLAVFRVQGSPSCYLFNCGKPDKCKLADNAKFSVIRRVNIVDHESELEGLAQKTKSIPTTTTTTTSQPTTTTRKQLVGLYGNCNTDKDCATPSTICLSGYCQCRQNYHPKEGYCRQTCNRYQFECRNAGQPLMTPQCVATYNVCDGIAHCKDGSDEENCRPTTSSIDDLLKFFEQVIKHTTHQPEQIPFLRPVNPNAQLPHGRKVYRPIVMKTEKPPTYPPSIQSPQLITQPPTEKKINNVQKQQENVDIPNQEENDQVNTNNQNEDNLSKIAENENNRDRGRENQNKIYQQKAPERKPQPTFVQQKFPTNSNNDNLDAFPGRSRQQFNNNRRYDPRYWAYIYQNPRRPIQNYYDAVDYDIDYSGKMKQSQTIKKPDGHEASMTRPKSHGSDNTDDNEQSKPSTTKIPVEIKQTKAKTEAFKSTTKSLIEAKSLVDVTTRAVKNVSKVRIENDHQSQSVKGAVIALCLGLIITSILLFFIAFKLRRSVRRYRKARHLNGGGAVDADYLVNGMYL
ncbi:DgyrCDS768 [Dimorphilus gyrociliatus]|uniref:DgyrCDS768 n=1 Tax=Dimorphilus gyrociliatus TaxID=2664684 RepID=A0A7I8V6V0_9ANNE|nr:DgyrCDS768 [Dimorphilus gyrociliatus]